MWDLECRRLAYSLQWETNITAFAVIHGTYLMCGLQMEMIFYFFLLLSSCLYECHFYCIRYIGDENGLMSVLRYNSEEGKLLRLPYNIPAKAIIGSFFFLAVRILQYYHVDLFCFQMGFLNVISYEISILIIYPLSTIVYLQK